MMKKMIAALLALVLTLCSAAALAAPPVAKVGEYCAGCGVGADFACKHGYNYGSQAFRKHNFPTMHDLDYTLDFKLEISKVQNVYAQVRSQGLKRVFGSALGNTEHLWEAFVFQASEHAGTAAPQGDVTLELRTKEAPSMYRAYRALLRLDGEWVEIPVAVTGQNYKLYCKCGEACTAVDEQGRLCRETPIEKLLAYYQVTLTGEQLAAIMNTEATIVIISP